MWGPFLQDTMFFCKPNNEAIPILPLNGRLTSEKPSFYHTELCQMRDKKREINPPMALLRYQCDKIPGIRLLRRCLGSYLKPPKTILANSVLWFSHLFQTGRQAPRPRRVWPEWVVEAVATETASKRGATRPRSESDGHPWATHRT